MTSSLPTQSFQARLRFKTIVVSDTHLGKKAASAAFLFEFLQNTSCDRLLLDGDILEGWGMKHKKRSPFPEMHARCLDALNAKAEGGTEVIYIRGNHDEDWAKAKRKLSGKTVAFRDKHHRHECPIKFRKSFQHEDAQGRTFLVLHGDVFDGFMKSAKKKVIAQYADRAYEGFVHLNGIFRQAVQDVTGAHISPAAYLKRKTKKTFGIIDDFERAVTSRRMAERFDGVICGHIHHAEITQKEDVLYMNSGDWVEGCTALVEDFEGNWHIIDWGRNRTQYGMKRVPSIFDKNPYESYRGVTVRQLGLARRLWPGTDYDDLVKEMWKYRRKLEHQNDRLAELFHKNASNDNLKKEQKIRRKIGEFEQKIEEIRERLAPVHDPVS